MAAEAGAAPDELPADVSVLVAAAGLDSVDLPSSVPAAAAEGADAAEASAPGAAASPTASSAGLRADWPSRKSVAYQPVPLSWKAGAVSLRANRPPEHDGHWVNGASDSFCSWSFSKPQSGQM